MRGTLGPAFLAGPSLTLATASAIPGYGLLATPLIRTPTRTPAWVRLFVSRTLARKLLATPLIRVPARSPAVGSQVVTTVWLTAPKRAP